MQSPAALLPSFAGGIGGPGPDPAQRIDIHIHTIIIDFFGRYTLARGHTKPAIGGTTVRAGIYIHIPFCLRKCPYCDFYSMPFDREAAERYVGAVIRSFDLFPALRCDTLYLGGGTPSLLEPRSVEKIVDAAARRFGLDASSEITLELNPATADAQGLRDFKSAGINRLSVGVQSLDDRVLALSGRLHRAADAVNTLEQAHAAGFCNLSADIILGLPSDDGRALAATVKRLVALPLTHLSAYMLKVAEGTPFAEKLPAPCADDDTAADLYNLCCDILEGAGFDRYEISNFAKKGFESRHNLKYWLGGDYIGTGAAAHGCIGGERYSFLRDARAFVETFLGGKTPVSAIASREGSADAEDMIMLRLRTARGLDLDELRRRYGVAFGGQKKRYLERCVRGGFAELDGTVLRLTRRGVLVSNEILSHLI